VVSGVVFVVFPLPRFRDRSHCFTAANSRRAYCERENDMKSVMPFTAGLILAASLGLAPAVSQAQLLGGSAGGSAGGALGGTLGSTAGAGGSFGASGGLDARSDMGGTLRDATDDARADARAARAQARATARNARATADAATDTDASASVGVRSDAGARGGRGGASAGGSTDVDASTDVEPGAVGAGVQSTTRGAVNAARSDARTVTRQARGAASRTTVSGGASVDGSASGSVH